MLSKAEMEKMWQSGPIGILKSHVKKTRGAKLFKVNILPYATVYMEEHSQVYEVWSKKQDDAIWEAKTRWYHEHSNVKQTGIQVRMVR